MLSLGDPDAIRAALAALNHVQSHALSEGATRAVYTKVVRGGDAVIDCGANCGEHTRSLSALVGPAGRVHAFEPNTALFGHLQGLGPNVRLWPFAVGEELALRTLHVPQGLDGWASLNDIRGLLTDREFALHTTAQVPLDGLEELAQTTVSFIKIDVERNELPALRGMRGLLGRTQPVIVLEGINPAIEAFLDEAGYAAYDLTGSPLEGGDAMLPNAAAMPRSFSAERVAGLLLSEGELRTLHEQATRPAPEPEAAPVPDTALLARLHETEAALTRLTGSLSWRVTAPLRRVRALFG